MTAGSFGGARYCSTTQILVRFPFCFRAHVIITLCSSLLLMLIFLETDELLSNVAEITTHNLAYLVHSLSLCETHFDYSSLLP